MRRDAKTIVVGLLVVAGLGIGALLLPLGDWILRLIAWVRGMGAAGVLVYVAVYVAATVLMVPGVILTGGAGLIWGPLLGTLIVSPASVVGATLAFLLGRTLARDWIARRLERDRRFAAIDDAVGAEGFKIVLLLRLSPLFPFNVLNYALGLTRVRLGPFVLGSFLGMLPGTALYVYLGSLVSSASELLHGGGPGAGSWRTVGWVVGLAATVIATVLVTRAARRALQRSLGPDATGAAPASDRQGSGSREVRA